MKNINNGSIRFIWWSPSLRRPWELFENMLFKCYYYYYLTIQLCTTLTVCRGCEWLFSNQCRIVELPDTCIMLDELNGAILCLVLVVFLTNPRLFQVFRRMPWLCFSAKLQKCFVHCQTFSCKVISFNTIVNTINTPSFFWIPKFSHS